MGITSGDSIAAASPAQEFAAAAASGPALWLPIPLGASLWCTMSGVDMQPQVRLKLRCMGARLRPLKPGSRWAWAPCRR